MQTLNREAMEIPAGHLLRALEERIERRRAVLEERDGARKKVFDWAGRTAKM